MERHPRSPTPATPNSEQTPCRNLFDSTPEPLNNTFRRFATMSPQLSQYFVLVPVAGAIDSLV